MRGTTRSLNGVLFLLLGELASFGVAKCLQQETYQRATDAGPTTITATAFEPGRLNAFYVCTADIDIIAVL